MFLVLQEKLKEKRPALTESLTQTLQAMHKSGCLNLADIVEGRFKTQVFLIHDFPSGEAFCQLMFSLLIPPDDFTYVIHALDECSI